MFDLSLLDSSPVRVPVLARRHWAISVVVGISAFLAGLSLLRAPLAHFPAKALVAQAAALGILAAFYSLMLCYVFVDARRQGLRVWAWLGITIILNLLGFLIYLIYSAAKTGDWKRATVPLAYMSEVAFVGVLVLVPLIYTDALPRGLLLPGFLVAPPSGTQPAPRATAAATKARRHEVDLTREPVVLPKGVPSFDEKPESPPDLIGSSLLPGLHGVPGGLGPANPASAISPIIVLPPPPASTTKVRPPVRIRQGGNVQAAKLIYQPKPDYPPLAKMARIEGSVRLEAVINKEGSIEALKVIDGPPLLVVRAAIEAVSRWRYLPTLLNGEPVEVLTEIDVNFKLAE